MPHIRVFTAKSGTSAQVPSAHDLNKMRIEARQLAGVGNFAAALKLMASVVRMQENPTASDYDHCTVYAWNMKRYEEGLAWCEESLSKLGRTVNTLHNLAAIHAKLRNHSAALAVGQELLELGEKNHRTYDLMAAAAQYAEDYEASARYGELALAALDASIPAAPPREFPQRKTFDPDKKDRNIISFSLWGQNARYLRGAVRNALLAHDLYPSWTCRFYLDESVPEEVTVLLRELQAQIVVMPRPKSPFEGLGWRFQIWDDQEVDFCLIRDCDAVFSAFETIAVNAWLRSALWFHIMRASYTHTELVLAGLWGGATGMLNNLHAGYVRNLNNTKTPTADQEYLREHAWPVIKQSALIHDRFHRLSGTIPFPDAEFWPGKGWHVGSNEAAGNPNRQELLLREYSKRCPSLSGRTTIIRLSDTVQTIRKK